MPVKATVVKQKDLSPDIFTRSAGGVRAVIEINSSTQFTEGFFGNLAKRTDGHEIVMIANLSFTPATDTSHLMIEIRCYDEPEQKLNEFVERIRTVGNDPSLLLDLPPLFPQVLKR